MIHIVKRLPARVQMALLLLSIAALSGGVFLLLQ
jgi:hypothetical protein